MPNLALPTDLVATRIIAAGTGRNLNALPDDGLFRQMVHGADGPSAALPVSEQDGGQRERASDRPDLKRMDILEGAFPASEDLTMPEAARPLAEPFVVADFEGPTATPESEGNDGINTLASLLRDGVAGPPTNDSPALLRSAQRDDLLAHQPVATMAISSMSVPLSKLYSGPATVAKPVDLSQWAARLPSSGLFEAKPGVLPETRTGLNPAVAAQASGQGRFDWGVSASLRSRQSHAQLEEIKLTWPINPWNKVLHETLAPVANPQAVLGTALQSGLMDLVPQQGLAGVHDAPEHTAFSNLSGGIQGGTLPNANSPLAPQLAQSTVAQVAQVAQANLHAPNDHVDIVLSPEELGRVRIQLQHSDMGLQVLIASERPETLDLLRKNIALLSRALSELGYGSPQFQFGEQGRERQGKQAMSGLDFSLGDPAALPVPVSANPTAQISSTGLDLRI